MASRVPPTLKGIGNYVKIANEQANRDPVVYYWCLYYAVQTAMQLDKKSPDALQFITSILGTLEAVKKQLHGNEALTSDIVAQAHLENFAWRLFKYADEKEKVGDVNKAVVHSFFTAGYVFDVLALFGEVDEGIANTKKYAKWKCMQINKCLTEGTPYVPSTSQRNEQDEEDDLLRQLTDFGAPGQPQQPAAPSHGAGHFEHNYDNPPPMVPGHSQIPGGNDYGFAAQQPQVPPPAAPQNYVPPPAYTPAFAPPPMPQPASPSPSTHSAPAAPGALKQPTLAEFTEARKYIKYAASAIDFEDTKAVVDNLRKALRLMEQ